MPLTDEQKAAKGKLEFELQRANRLSNLVNDPVVKETLTGLLHGIQNAWGAEQDRDAREVLWHRYNAITELVGSLATHIDSGKFAAIQLETYPKE